MDLLRIFTYLVIFCSVISCQSLEENTISKEVRNAREASNPIVEKYDLGHLYAAIDSFLQTSPASETYVGMGLSIVMGDSSIYEKGLGYSDINRKTRVNGNTIFRIGSLSKSFTGVLCAILTQSNEGLDYDSKLSTHLPKLVLSNAEYTKEIRLKHLLSHTGGFPYHSYTNLVESGLEADKILPYFSEISNLTRPGTVYSYQNAAYSFIGSFLENKYSMPLDSLFKLNLFQPLGMTRTSTDFKSIATAQNVAMPHRRNGNSWQVKKLNHKYYNAIAAGGINTSISDMGKLLKLILLEDPQILSTEARDSMLAPRIRTKVGYRYYKRWPDFYDSYYGYGWRLHELQNSDGLVSDTLIHHGGMVNNYRSEIAINLKEEVAVAVLLNSYSSLSETIIPDILALIRQNKKPTVNDCGLEN